MKESSETMENGIETPVSEDHSVVVYFDKYYYEELDELFALDDKLEKIIRENKVGRYDFHEIAVDGSDGSIYMYGANAETLFKLVKPILETTDFMKGATAMLRFGPGADDPAIEIELD